MGQLSVGSTNRVVAGLLLGGLAAGLALQALGSAPIAQATCGSINGMSLGQGCTSGAGDIVFAFGAGATASATGSDREFVFAFGNGAVAKADDGRAVAL